MRYFIELEYVGINFHGWQKQPNAHTIQEELEYKIETLIGETIALIGAGRTDTGVHAKQTFAHFDTNKILSESFLVKLNRFLPPQICAKNIFRVKNDAHARFNATKRTYEYLIATRKSPFYINFAYLFTSNLDLKAMNESCNFLIGRHNFKSFCKSHSDNESYDCNVVEAKFTTDQNEFIVFTISANRFLRNMVRAIVGTLINVGTHKYPPKYVCDILSYNDRKYAGFSVPAHGLYLKQIEYPQSIKY